MSDWMQRLQDAKQMLDAGLMTQQEFDALRKSIMSERGLGTVPPIPEPSSPLDGTKDTVVGADSFDDPLSGAEGTMVGGDP